MFAIGAPRDHLTGKVSGKYAGLILLPSLQIHVNICTCGTDAYLRLV
jgi:hypothetical protein